MISQDDIDAFKDEEEVKNALTKQAMNLSYEFHPEYLFNLLKISMKTQIKLTDEQLEKIAGKAMETWTFHHNR